MHVDVDTSTARCRTPAPYRLAQRYLQWSRGRHRDGVHVRPLNSTGEDQEVLYDQSASASEAERPICPTERSFTRSWRTSRVGRFHPFDDDNTAVLPSSSDLRVPHTMRTICHGADLQRRPFRLRRIAHRSRPRAPWQSRARYTVRAPDCCPHLRLDVPGHAAVD